VSDTFVRLNQELEALLARHIRIGQGFGRYTSEDLKSLPLDQLLLAHLTRMLQEDGSSAASALFVILCMMEGHETPYSEFKPLLPRLRKLASRSAFSGRSDALLLLARYGDETLPMEIERMLDETDPPDALFALLRAYGTPYIIPRLFRFAHDEFASETRGMGGPMRFVRRDEAFLTIEAIAKQTFPRNDVAGHFGAEPCSFYNWSPVYSWWLTSSYRNRPILPHERLRISIFLLIPLAAFVVGIGWLLGAYSVFTTWPEPRRIYAFPFALGGAVILWVGLRYSRTLLKEILNGRVAEVEGQVRRKENGRLAFEWQQPVEDRLLRTINRAVSRRFRNKPAQDQKLRIAFTIGEGYLLKVELLEQ